MNTPTEILRKEIKFLDGFIHTIKHRIGIAPEAPQEKLDKLMAELKENKKAFRAAIKILNEASENKLYTAVSGSLPLDDEDVLEPIQNALYATHAFSLDDCTGLSNGILSYLKEAGFAIVRGNDR